MLGRLRNGDKPHQPPRETHMARQPHAPQGPPNRLSGTETYSHSMVAGGFDVTSSTTRLISGTELVMRLEIFANKS